MALGHERLDVYRLTIAYVAWVYEKSATLEGVHRAARDQWLRCSVGWAEEDTRASRPRRAARWGVGIPSVLRLAGDSSPYPKISCASCASM